MNRICPFHLLTLVLLSTCLLAQESRLLRHPDISATHITFVFAQDVWIAERTGGAARRLTTFPGAETNPHFSPDGQFIAFTGEYDGNADVYVLAVQGGEPRRLTWHPANDIVRGWSTDGEKVVFASNRESAPVGGLFKFWTIALSEKMPQALPIPRVAEGDYSPDGERFVYQRIMPWESEWRNYRGGQNNPIRIIDLASYKEEELPWDGANDNTPVWMGDRIYFLSDRDFTMNIWSYDLRTKSMAQVTFFKEFDCKRLEGDENTLIFENGGYLYLLDSSTGTPEKLSITAHGDFPWARPHWEKVGGYIAEHSLSPQAKRAVFAARGDIYTVPAKKGDVRNLTSSSGAADRNPAWSPDGKLISWFSDASGEYQLVIANQYGQDRKNFPLPNPTFYYTPRWSPDSKFISFSDADRNLWLFDIEKKSAERLDDEGFAHPDRIIYPEWSPDSKWIAYARRLTNQYSAIFVYSLEQKKSYQLTDGLSDCKSPAWDAGGKYLYFLGSTDYGLNVGWLDMSSLGRPSNRAIYLAVLAKDEPSPLLPESDDETAEDEEKKKEGEKKSDGKKESDKKQDEKDDAKEDDEKIKPAVKIDLDRIEQRIIALALPARDYSELKAGKEGTLFYLESIPNADGGKLSRYVLKDRESKDVLSGVYAYSLSADGEKLIYTTGHNSWAIADANGEVKAGEGKIKTDEMQTKVDPAAEWRQIFREAWRFQRDYFYVDNVHGLDLAWAYETYSPWVEFVRHRSDLTYILDILGGETAIGHSFTGGGDEPDVEQVPVGLLGADYKIENNRFRIAQIYTGENWNPDLRAPLSSPGLDVHEGDYLVMVNGVELTGDMNIYSLFDQTAGKQIAIRINDKPQLEASREMTVVPVSDEAGLRQRDWIERNRRIVDELSGGRLAYVWLPNTGGSGYASFNRYYFAQQDKKGAVIDERFNEGGLIADYIVDLLSRELLGYFNNPIGDRQPFLAPNAALYGPKVMIINDAAGSGGDMLPYMFRMKKIGPLVGTRTWGGLVGIWDVPALLDGGYITAPRGGFYNVQGEWDVENKGITPDVTVEQEPVLVNAGHDPQLEKAVQVALELLETEEVKLLPQPQDPIRVKRAK